MENSIKLFTQQQLSDQWFVMETTMLECMIAEDLRSDDVKIFKSKNEGVYYLISTAKKENGKPEKVYFKKDFRK